MTRLACASTVALLLAAILPLASFAQAADSMAVQGRTAPARADTARLGRSGGFRPLRVAKWSALVAATAAGVYGFVENARADDRFAALEALCEAEKADCRERAADGAYRDAALEDLYQAVRRHDRRAHYALLAGQIGVAASVGLFLLDLGNVRRPEDVPWVPGTVRLERGRDELRLSVRLPLGHGRE